jgi:RHH-type proline utilization regulon transcriptional repressor/proline dehydrogenase/delta 1-pyrroline-5-carboxylate dehydrogenase
VAPVVAGALVVDGAVELVPELLEPPHAATTSTTAHPRAKWSERFIVCCFAKMGGSEYGRFDLSTLALEDEVHRVGIDLAGAFPSNARHPIRALDSRAMVLASRDRELRAALFRFVDVVPACRSLEDVARHLRGFLEELPEAPPPIAAAMRIADVRAARAALGAAAAAGVKHMAHRFIVGETPAAAIRVLQGLWEHGVASSVDLLGEATVTEAEADQYAARCANAIKEVSRRAAKWPSRPRLEADGIGPLPRANVSVKISALTPLLRADAPRIGQRDAAERLRPLLRRAHELGAHVHIDMESLDSREAVFELVLELLSDPEFASGPSAGIVLQAYLRDSPDQLESILEWTRSSNRASPLTVRLVKGAYWDHELVEARQHGWPAPVFEVKADCDRNFEALTRTLLDARPAVRVAVASHNLRSVSHAIAYNRLSGADDRELELQVLRGLGDELQDALAARCFRVRTYCPVGDLVAGMAYLVRRLLENTSNESFLHEQASGTALDELLAAP